MKEIIKTDKNFENKTFDLDTGFINNIFIVSFENSEDTIDPAIKIPTNITNIKYISIYFKIIFLESLLNFGCGISLFKLYQLISM